MTFCYLLAPLLAFFYVLRVALLASRLAIFRGREIELACEFPIEIGLAVYANLKHDLLNAHGCVNKQLRRPVEAVRFDEIARR